MYTKGTVLINLSNQLLAKKNLPPKSILIDSKK
jgi:hypothetical protein